MQLEIVELNEAPREDPVIDRILSHLQDSAIRCWVVGGAARSLHTGEPINDYDIVFGDQQSLDVMRSTIIKLGAEAVSQTYGYPYTDLIGEDYSLNNHFIQLKYPKFYSNVAEQLDSADFTVCQFFFSLGQVGQGECRFGCSSQALIDSKLRILRLHKLTQPAATIARITKFVNKGYNPISGTEFFKPLVEQIRALPFDATNFEPIRKKRTQKR